jgi:hypothetical protein
MHVYFFTLFDQLLHFVYILQLGFKLLSCYYVVVVVIDTLLVLVLQS